MWSDIKSIKLSKLCVRIFMGLLIGAAVSAPWLTGWFIGYSPAELIGTNTYFLITIYVGCLPAGALLYFLYRLLQHIEDEQVFTDANVELLRRISWSCFTGAFIGLVSAYYYYPWIILSIAAAFMGLTVRVVKNVMAKAVELQDEVDSTI